MNRLMQILPHANIVLAGLVIVLVILDCFNGSMGFLSGDDAKVLILVCGVLAIANAIALISVQRRMPVRD